MASIHEQLWLQLKPVCDQVNEDVLRVMFYSNALRINSIFPEDVLCMYEDLNYND